MRDQAAAKLGLAYGEVSVSPVPLQSANKRGNKFGAVKVESVDGTFHSKKEYRDWLDLKLREAAGEISKLRRQVRFSLFDPGGACRGEHFGTYKADFVWRDKRGDLVVADSKGHKTREWKRIQQLMLACHNIVVREL